MTTVRVVLLAVLVALSAIALAGTSVEARNPPNTGCGGAPVEVCIIVCIDGPCESRICVHDPNVDVCHRF